MAFKNFSEELWVKVQETGLKNGLGRVTSENEFTLDTVRAVVYIQGVASLGGSETLQMKLYSDAELTKEYAASDIVDVSSFVTGSSNWIGFIGFKFASLPNINSRRVYAGIEAGSYTRSGDTFFISFVFDWPLNHNDFIPGNRGGWIELYGYQNRDDIQ
jgi:hypothetical protein